MIRYLLILIFILLNSSLFGQFRMIGNGTWATLTDSTFSSTVNFQVDLTGMGYLATQIVDTFRVFTGIEQIYDVIVVGATTFSSAELTIQERGGNWGSPVGQVMVYDPAGRVTLPEVPFASIGSTGQMTAAVTTYNGRLVGGDGNGIFDSGNDGGTVPAGMSVTLTDSLIIENSNSTSYRPGLTLRGSTGFFGQGAGLAIDADPSGESFLGANFELLNYYFQGIQKLRFYNIGDIITFQTLDDNDLQLIGDRDVQILGVAGKVRIDFGDSLTIAPPLPYIDSDSVLVRLASSGKIGQMAVSDIPGQNTNGVFDAVNDGGTVPTGMDINLTDSLNFIKTTNIDGEPYINLTYDQPGNPTGLTFIEIDLNENNTPILTNSTPLLLNDQGQEVFKWNYFNLLGTKTMGLFGTNGTSWNLSSDADVQMQALGTLTIGGSTEDSLIILAPLPYIPADSILTKTPSGRLSMMAAADAGMAAPQYAQVYMTGGTNTDVDVGIPERLNATTLGTVTPIVNTSEFTIESDGDIQYLGANNRVIKATVDFSIDTAFRDEFLAYYIAVDGVVVTNSRIQVYADDNYGDGHGSINFYDTDADTNDTYAVYVAPISNPNLSLTIKDVRLTLEVIN